MSARFSSRLVLAVLLAAATAAAAAEVRQGTLVIHTEPGAELYWEGIGLGAVDPEGRIRIERIPPGTYRVLVRKRGFLDLTTEVLVVSGEGAVALPLEALPPAPEPATPYRPSPAEPATTAASTVVAEPASEPEAAAKPPPEDPSALAGPAPDEPLERPARAGRLPWLAALALAGGALWLLLRRRRKLLAAALEPDLLAPAPARRPGQSAPPSFLADIKRREGVLEKMIESDPRRAEDQIIDVEVIDLQTVEEEG